MRAQFGCDILRKGRTVSVFKTDFIVCFFPLSFFLSSVDSIFIVIIFYTSNQFRVCVCVYVETVQDECEIYIWDLLEISIYQHKYIYFCNFLFLFYSLLFLSSSSSSALLRLSFFVAVAALAIGTYYFLIYLFRVCNTFFFLYHHLHR